ncbi:hypothetical protein O3M35_000814 [Rhynocoris fuscipes]|uniref:PiggyBac transposable element-derived protein domain-containing protein n=1 Tax=Rhynocoris fuscipes TaxID=488301 RepID=A0AAW1DTD0_9HEMI
MKRRLESSSESETESVRTYEEDSDSEYNNDSISDSECDSNSDSDDCGYKGGNIKRNVIEDLVASDGKLWKDLTIFMEGNSSITNIEKSQKLYGPNSNAKSGIKQNSPLSAFKLFFDDSLIDFVLECTNEHGSEMNPKVIIKRSELFIFIALTYARAVLDQNDTKLYHLYSDIFECKLYSKFMSFDRYMTILKTLRFDKKSTRNERLKDDKFALLSFIWNKFMTKSRTFYDNSDRLAVYEQFYPMKCHCRFLQCNSNRKSKFGMKFWFIIDTKTKYILNGVPYLGIDELLTSSCTVEENALLRLLQPFSGTNISITCNHTFTSVYLAEELKKMNISIVGTLKKKRKDVPNTNRLKSCANSTKIYKNHLGHTLISYKRKKNKTISILSTLHSDNIEILDGIRKIPDVLKYYNEDRNIVSQLNRINQSCSTKTSCSRWTSHVFLNILDLVVINSWILYKNCYDKTISRRNFVAELVEEIINYENEQMMKIAMLNEEPKKIYKRKQCEVENSKKKCLNITAWNCTLCKKYCCGSQDKNNNLDLTCCYNPRSGNILKSSASSFCTVHQEVSNQTQHPSVRPPSLLAGSSTVQLLSIALGEIRFKMNKFESVEAAKEKACTQGTDSKRLPVRFRTMVDLPEAM